MHQSGGWTNLPFVLPTKSCPFSLNKAPLSMLTTLQIASLLHLFQCKPAMLHSLVQAVTLPPILPQNLPSAACAQQFVHLFWDMVSTWNEQAVTGWAAKNTAPPPKKKISAGNITTKLFCDILSKSGSGGKKAPLGVRGIELFRSSMYRVKGQPRSRLFGEKSAKDHPRFAEDLNQATIKRNNTQPPPPNMFILHTLN